MTTGRTNRIGLSFVRTKRFACAVQMQFISLRLISLTSAPSMIFENHASAHASMADDAFTKIAHETIIQHESLILAQDERWRRA